MNFFIDIGSMKVTGRVTPTGKFEVFEKDAMFDFFRNNKNKRIVATFEVVECNCSESQKGFYYRHIVPQFQKAIWSSGYRKTEEETEQFLRTLSPITKKQTVDVKTGKYSTSVLEINELSSNQLSHFMEHLKQIAAEEYSFFICD